MSTPKHPSVETDSDTDPDLPKSRSSRLQPLLVLTDQEILPTIPRTPTFTRPNQPIRVDTPRTSKGSSNALDPYEALSIPYRLRLYDRWWDFLDTKLVQSNTRKPPEFALGDPHTVTEISEEWIMKEALSERKLRYQMVMLHIGNDDQTTILRRFCFIEHVLGLDELTRLVERSGDLYRASRANIKTRRWKEHDKGMSRRREDLKGSSRTTPAQAENITRHN
jgi:hypothetical protein